jgi:hypothetical protein
MPSCWFAKPIKVVYDFFEMASRAPAAVVVLSMFLSGALPPSGTLCAGGHPAEDQHDHERALQDMPAIALDRTALVDRSIETTDPVLRDGCCSVHCAQAEPVAVVEKVLPWEKSAQNESTIAQAATELLTHDQTTMTILSPQSPDPPPGMEPSSSILRV